ncbi:protein of unknown function [Hyphomicrobium sp. MC1]|nr:protein of unknown function [Hyphomicrobium sp. MC1]
MSKGQGKVQRAIAAILQQSSAPMTIEELAARVYPDQPLTRSRLNAVRSVVRKSSNIIRERETYESHGSSKDGRQLRVRLKLVQAPRTFILRRKAEPVSDAH